MPELNDGVRCLAIEGAPEVMEEVRAAVLHGYFRLAHGGLEVGGLLLGRRDGGTLHIAASRPIFCQYAYGPTFTLSDSDLAGLAKLLEASSSESELKGLVPVGWYHSHTRGDLELSDRDLEVHNRWFPEAWQVALVLRPERMRAIRAAFYVRDAQGLPRREPEFVVEPLAGLRRTILAIAAVPRVEPRQEAPAAPEPVPSELVSAPPALELAPAPPEPASAPPAPVAAEGPPPTIEIPLPAFLQSPAPAAGPSRRWRWWFALAWSVAPAPAPPEPASAPPELAPAPALPEPDSPPAPPESASAPEPPELAPAPAPPEPDSAPPDPVAAEGPPPTVELPLPSFLQSPAPRARPSRRWWWWWFALAWAVAGVSSAVALRNYWLPKSPAALQVALQDMGGQLAIQWDKEAQAIQEAEGGVLEIQDGDHKRVLKMSGPDMRGASVVVRRQSGRVTVRLQARLPRGRTAEGRARFEGEPVQSEPANERERLEAEVQRLQTDLASQKQRNRELEAAIATLQKRLAEGP